MVLRWLAGYLDPTAELLAVVGLDLIDVSLTRDDVRAHGLLGVRVQLGGVVEPCSWYHLAGFAGSARLLAVIVLREGFRNLREVLIRQALDGDLRGDLLALIRAAVAHHLEAKVPGGAVLAGLLRGPRSEERAVGVNDSDIAIVSEVAQRLVDLDLHREVLTVAERAALGRRRHRGHTDRKPLPLRDGGAEVLGAVLVVLRATGLLTQRGGEELNVLRHLGGRGLVVPALNLRGVGLRGLGGAGGQNLHGLGEGLGVLGVQVLAAAGLGDALQLLAGSRVDQEADGVDGQVDALLVQVLGDVADRWRGAGVLAVGDQHDGALALVRQLLGGLLQGRPHGGVAGGVDLVHLARDLARVALAHGQQGGDVLTASLSLLRGVADLGAIDHEAQLGVLGDGAGEVLGRLLRRVQAGLAARVAGHHGARCVEDQHGRRDVLGFRRGLWLLEGDDDPG